ncbi:DNA polymerase III subunit delta' [Hyphococcus sp.]|uniref:DNA polymerase III subunit delta' n=1 Tax=Hyphococcus sp. TaxID=2038636 RepID=UPI003CCBEA27
MEDAEFIPPQNRIDSFGHEALEKRLRQTMADGALSHGWIISGPSGAGKATLAYRLARALLEPQALTSNDSLQMSDMARAFRLIASNAHPDLFVAERIWDAKKSKYQTDITVDTIRRLTGFLNRTAAEGGARVAIIDTADDMNRNAANALLKVLEEPPQGAVLLLLSASPGRLLPTIRSRCRTIEAPLLEQSQLFRFLSQEGVDPSTAEIVSAVAKGRPGYALQLASSEGVEAINLARSFLKIAVSHGDLSRIIAGVSGKAGEGRWPIFRDMILTMLSDTARDAARGNNNNTHLSYETPALLMAWEGLKALLIRGEALNLDRGQLLHAMAHDLREALFLRAA